MLCFRAVIIFLYVTSQHCLFDDRKVYFFKLVSIRLKVDSSLCPAAMSNKDLHALCTIKRSCHTGILLGRDVSER